jgi:hypothetical protein
MPFLQNLLTGSIGLNQNSSAAELKAYLDSYASTHDLKLNELLAGSTARARLFRRVTLPLDTSKAKTVSLLNGRHILRLGVMGQMALVFYLV